MTARHVPRPQATARAGDNRDDIDPAGDQDDGRAGRQIGVVGEQTGIAAKAMALLVTASVVTWQAQRAAAAAASSTQPPSASQGHESRDKVHDNQH